MIATATRIKMKVMAVVAVAWWQHGRQHSGIAAAAAALLQHSTRSAVAVAAAKGCGWLTIRK